MNQQTPVIYRRHKCTRAHRGYRTFAKCIWTRAAWIAGNGAFAVVASCRATTVTLHHTLDAAHLALQTIDATGCGGACTRQHRLIRLEPTP